MTTKQIRSLLNLEQGLSVPEENTRENMAGVLSTVVRRCVWFRNLVNEKALAYWGLWRQKNVAVNRHNIYNNEQYTHVQNGVWTHYGWHKKRTMAKDKIKWPVALKKEQKS